MILDIIFDKEQIIERKYNKTWITINIVCKITRIHKVKLWFIGKAVVSCCFGQLFINITTFE